MKCDYMHMDEMKQQRMTTTNDFYALLNTLPFPEFSIIYHFVSRAHTHTHTHLQVRNKFILYFKLFYCCIMNTGNLKNNSIYSFHSYRALHPVHKANVYLFGFGFCSIILTLCIYLNKLFTLF